MSFRRIRIIEPAGKAHDQALQDNCGRLVNCGFEVIFEPSTANAGFPMSAASDSARAEALMQALTEDHSDVVFAARGGYGASSVLDLLDFRILQAAKPKLLIGFSDISVLHSALFTQLGRAGMHAPMPGSTLYGESGTDIDVLHQMLLTGLPMSGKINVTPLESVQSVEGWLFGGNMATLTNLIGTPWFPSSLHNAVVFLEDINEHAGRVGRNFSQWCQSGALEGVRAIVLGQFIHDSDAPAACRETIIGEITRRTNIPVFDSPDFGHVSPNHALAIGAKTKIGQGELSWQLDTLTPFD